MRGPGHFAAAALAAALALALAGCGAQDGEAALLWTDDADVAIAAELFNAAQDERKVEVEYRADLAAAFVAAEKKPDIVAGSWLSAKECRAALQSADYLFSDLLVPPLSFYPELLALGNFGGRQVLLPLSIDFPAVIYAKGAAAVSDPNVVGLDEVRKLGHAYDKKKGDSFSRMGFSPLWSADAPYAVASLFGAGFREGSPVAWDQAALDSAVAYMRDWLADDGGAEAEDRFRFKYLYDPEYKLASDGRILFGYMRSDKLLTLAGDKLSALDFRWIAKDGRADPAEDAKFLGVARKGGGSGATEAFIRWLFSAEGQRAVLKAKRAELGPGASFGIAGGFSALKAVNESVLPEFYPALKGRLPPFAMVKPREPLPRRWDALKRAVVEKWVEEAVKTGSPAPSLKSRVEDWLKQND